MRRSWIIEELIIQLRNCNSLHRFNTMKKSRVRIMTNVRNLKQSGTVHKKRTFRNGSCEESVKNLMWNRKATLQEPYYFRITFFPLFLLIIFLWKILQESFLNFFHKFHFASGNDWEHLHSLRQGLPKCLTAPRICLLICLQ